MRDVVNVVKFIGVLAVAAISDHRGTGAIHVLVTLQCPGTKEDGASNPYIKLWVPGHRYPINGTKNRRNLNMCKAALACLLVLIPCSLCAQERKGDWQALYGLHSGEKIELIETGMKKHVGIFSAVSEEAIEMREGSNDIAIRKESVVRVTVLDKSHRLRNSLLFGGVGAGAGAGIGAAASRCSNSNNTFNFCGLGRSVAVGIGAVAGLLGGAGVGAAIPSHPTIYRAEAAKSTSNALPDGSNQESMRQ